MTLLQLGLNGPQFILVSAIVLVVGWVCFYHTIKAAVKNGMIESQAPPTFNANTYVKKEDSVNLSEAQKDLKSRYELGELTIKEYQDAWNKLG